MAARRRLGQAPPPAAIRPPPAAAAAAAAVLLLLWPQAAATSSARRTPPQAAPVTTGHPASSSLEASILPPGPATRHLPSPKATRRRWARPRRRRDRARHQSHWKREFNHAQRLRPAVKPTAWAPPGPAHCSEQRKGPGPGAAEATRRHKAPSEPRDGVGRAFLPGLLREACARSSRQQTPTHWQGRHGNRVTRAGENSAGGAQRPELGKAPQPPPGQSSKPPKCHLEPCTTMIS